MKLCKDCKHFVKAADWEQNTIMASRYAICGLTDPVGGGDGVRCYDMRAERWFPDAKHRPYCGPDARQFEQRQS